TRYSALMQHYGCAAQKTNARCANENGDVESLNGHLKDRIDQALYCLLTSYPSGMMTSSSKKPQRSTGDWLPEGNGTPQDHAHVGRTARGGLENAFWHWLPIRSSPVNPDVRRQQWYHVRPNAICPAVFVALSHPILVATRFERGA
ncbi:hypothetical protein, partial [Rhodopirellula bahusiensis]